MSELPFIGFRFYPTEEELVGFYLPHMLANPPDDRFSEFIPVLNIYGHDPWQLPEMAGVLNRRDREQWFFYCPRQEREAQGGKPNRITPSGYWKATGSPGFVFSLSNHKKIGTKRTLVFHQGRASTRTKTPWKMNEYSFIPEQQPITDHVNLENQRNEFSLCRIYVSSGCTRTFDRRPLVSSADA